MTLDEIYQSNKTTGYILWNQGFFISEKKGTKEERRRALAYVFKEIPYKKAWEAVRTPHYNLPKVIESHPFLRMYVEAWPLRVASFRKIYESQRDVVSRVQVYQTQNADEYYNVRQFSPKPLERFIPTWHKKKDPRLLEHLQHNLDKVAQIDDHQVRKWLSLALLTKAAFRELEGKILYVPSFETKEVMIPYTLSEHMLWHGIKTVSCVPLENSYRGIYICQGTETSPVQPHMLATVFANLGIEGAATEPYAHSWRQIHRHLRELAKITHELPIVVGYSMGGSLATQIALYSHPFIAEAVAFNPPVVEERDFELFNQLSDTAKEKLKIFANIDDLPFWRLGSKVIGKVHLLFGEKRWKYHRFTKWDRILLIPAFIKGCINVFHMVPSHQDLVFLMRTFCIMPLSQEEVQIENDERTKRAGYILIFKKFYRPVRFLVQIAQRLFRWNERLEYVKNELEIAYLHELDLEETFHLMPDDNIARELDLIKQRIERLEEEVIALTSRSRKYL